MQLARAGAIKLEFEARGAGEALVLIHGSVIADSYVPIMGEPPLSHFRLIRYRRRGYGGSTHSAPPVSIRDQAADCMALMRHLGVERAHVAGHSYGGAIAIQLALDFPRAVHSLMLLEPALVFKVPASARLSEQMLPMRVKYECGDRTGALEHFMEVVEGPAWRNAADAVAGAWQMAVADADNFFQIEGAALLEWSFGPDDARRIKQPILAVVGADTAAVFRETHELTLSWFPKAEPVVIPGATHMLPLVQPRAVALALSDFMARHPIAAERVNPVGNDLA